MAIYSTLVNKATAFKIYSNKSLSNLDLDDGGGKNSSTCNTTLKPTAIAVRIFNTPVTYTKA